MRAATLVATFLILAATAARAQTDMGGCLADAARQPDPMVDIACIDLIMEFDQSKDIVKVMTGGIVLLEADKASANLSDALSNAAPPIRSEMEEVATLYARSLDQCGGPKIPGGISCRVSVAGNNLLVLTALLREHLERGTAQ